jgi:hypothetical protein
VCERAVPRRERAQPQAAEAPIEAFVDARQELALGRDDPAHAEAAEVLGARRAELIAEEPAGRRGLAERELQPGRAISPVSREGVELPHALEPAHHEQAATGTRALIHREAVAEGRDVLGRGRGWTDEVLVSLAREIREARGPAAVAVQRERDEREGREASERERSSRAAAHVRMELRRAADGERTEHVRERLDRRAHAEGLPAHARGARREAQLHERRLDVARDEQDREPREHARLAPAARREGEDADEPRERDEDHPAAIGQGPDRHAHEREVEGDLRGAVVDAMRDHPERRGEPEPRARRDPEARRRHGARPGEAPRGRRACQRERGHEREQRHDHERERVEGGGDREADERRCEATAPGAAMQVEERGQRVEERGDAQRGGKERVSEDRLRAPGEVGPHVEESEQAHGEGGGPGRAHAHRRARDAERDGDVRGAHDAHEQTCGVVLAAEDLREPRDAPVREGGVEVERRVARCRAREPGQWPAARGLIDQLAHDRLVDATIEAHEGNRRAPRRARHHDARDHDRQVDERPALPAPLVEITARVAPAAQQRARRRRDEHEARLERGRGHEPRERGHADEDDECGALRAHESRGCTREHPGAARARWNPDCTFLTPRAAVLDGPDHARRHRSLARLGGLGPPALHRPR